MGESRNELLAWINDLLQVNYRKIEQAGTGAAYCQIMDSIYGNVHMSKVKFETKHEYEYVANYKVLQHTFEKHKIDKVIPVDRLMKCKFQDNLEFTQWLKRFWDQNFPGGDYDALQRRKGGAVGGGGLGGVAKAGSRSVGAAAPGAARRALSSPGAKSATGRSSRNGSSMDQGAAAATIAELNKQISELKLTVDGLEKERDFYFGKLRQVEILVQQQIDALEDQGHVGDVPVLKEIQHVLYTTEDGFEAPPEDEVGDVLAATGGGGMADHHDSYDDETF